MSSGDPRERIDEYLDGLLPPDEAEAMERALRADPVLRAEFEGARGFAALLDGLRPRAEGAAVRRAVAQARGLARRRLWRRIGLAAAAAAVLAVGLLLGGSGSPAGAGEGSEAAAWREFGSRLGAMAAERRAGRVPRIGLADLAAPPARGMGVVFRAALGRTGVELAPGLEAAVDGALRDHFVAVERLGEGVQGECRRAEAELELFRRLRSLAGAEVAAAYYDVFRPGLADLDTARRVPGGTLVRDLGEDYGRAYEAAVARLRRWYGEEKVQVVLSRLAPEDRRERFRDASQDGVGRDAVLTMRAELYRAAAGSGVDALYVEIG